MSVARSLALGRARSTSRSSPRTSAGSRACVLDRFVDGAFYLRGTDYVTFLQRRLVEQLADAAELRILATDIELPTFAETMWWHPKAAKDAAHAWLRERIIDAAASLDG